MFWYIFGGDLGSRIGQLFASRLCGDKMAKVPRVPHGVGRNRYDIINLIFPDSRFDEVVITLARKSDSTFRMSEMAS